MRDVVQLGTFVVASYDVSDARPVTMVLYALTKFAMFFDAALVSREIENVVPLASTFLRSSVRPSIASVTWLSGFEIGSPSIANFASTASATCCVCGVPPAAAGSNASCDRPLASTALPSSSAVVMRNPRAAPVAVPDSTRRLPVPSLTIDAVTPAFAPLIASRMPTSELFVASIAMVVLPTSPFGVKAV